MEIECFPLIQIPWATSLLKRRVGPSFRVCIKGLTLVLGSLFNPDVWACVLGMRASNPSVAPPTPQLLTKASVGKGCIASRIRCDTHVATQEGFDQDFVAIQRLVIMMASRFSRLFRMWLLVSLKTSPDRLHFVPLLLKLFCLYKFGLPFFFSCILSDYRSGLLFVVPDISLGACVPRLVSSLGKSFLLLCFFFFLVSKSCEALGRARLGLCIFFDFPFFLT